VKDEKPQRPSPVPALRVVAWSVLIASALVAAFLIYNRTERFLIRDERFALSGPDGSGNATLEITGASHVSTRAVEAVFSEDLGRSVYLIPLTERRASLRAVDWVKDASVARMWPNRLQVRIEERIPVAFVTLRPSRTSSSRFGLIDEDGVILPPTPDRFGLPVLAGVKASDSIGERRVRVQRMLRLLRDLGDQGRNLSEIDVSDAEDVAVMEPRDGRVLKLLLGDRNYALRYRNFVIHYAEIVERLPGAVTLDLRLEDRITVVE
jgi:cell division protein FtsQ